MNTEDIFNENERLKPIPGYSRYFVSEAGKVYSTNKNKEKFEMSPLNGKFVKLCNNGAINKCQISYLVARAFIENPYMRPYVVHLNGDSMDNRAENLAWSESKDHYIANVAKKKSFSVLQMSDEGMVVNRFRSISEAARRTNIPRQYITKCVHGECWMAGGFCWRYDFDL